MNRMLGTAARASIVALAVATGCHFKSVNPPEPPETPEPVPLPHAFTPEGGLVRLHYDDDFQLNPEKSVTFLKPAAATQKSFIAIITNAKPITEDTAEYARVLQSAREKTLAGYKLISMTPTACYRDIPGVETRWQFGDSGKTLTSRACAFIHNHHGYSLMYAVDPESPSYETKLRRIVDATELMDAPPPPPAVAPAPGPAPQPRVAPAASERQREGPAAETRAGEATTRTQ
jgi:hypothetical protein